MSWFNASKHFEVELNLEGLENATYISGSVAAELVIETIVTPARAVPTEDQLFGNIQ